MMRPLFSSSRIKTQKSTGAPNSCPKTTVACMARHVLGVYFFTDSARRDSVLCDQHYCIDRFYARQFLPCACASRSPTRPIRQGKVCCAGRNMHMVRRDGQSMRRLVIRKVFVLFSAIYSYDLNRCLRCVCQGTRHEDLEYTLR